MNAHCCPKCESSETQAIKMIRSMGTSTTRGTSISLGNASVPSDDNDVAKRASLFGVAFTNQTSISDLAKKFPLPRKPAGPPKDGSIQAAVIVGVIVSAIGIPICAGAKADDAAMSVMAAIITLPALVFFVYYSTSKTYEKQRVKYDDQLDLYEREIAKYENTFLCLRCGHDFLVK